MRPKVLLDRLIRDLVIPWGFQRIDAFAIDGDLTAVIEP